MSGRGSGVSCVIRAAHWWEGHTCLPGAPCPGRWPRRGASVQAARAPARAQRAEGTRRLGTRSHGGEALQASQDDGFPVIAHTSLLNNCSVTSLTVNTLAFLHSQIHHLKSPLWTMPTLARSWVPQTTSRGRDFSYKTLLVSAGQGSKPWTHLKVSILFLFYFIINELTANKIFSRSSHHLISS